MIVLEIMYFFADCPEIPWFEVPSLIALGAGAIAQAFNGSVCWLPSRSETAPPL